jgi:hypothetical protein
MQAGIDNYETQVVFLIMGYQYIVAAVIRINQGVVQFNADTAVRSYAMRCFRCRTAPFRFLCGSAKNPPISKDRNKYDIESCGRVYSVCPSNNSKALQIIILTLDCFRRMDSEILVGLLDKTVDPSSTLQRLFEQSRVFKDVQQKFARRTVIRHLFPTCQRLCVIGVLK